MPNDYAGILLCAVGIYASFLTWALVQEPLLVKIWPNSMRRFDAPCIVAIVQAFCAMCIGYIYLRYKNRDSQANDGVSLVRKQWRWLAMISFTQSTSTPLSNYSLQYVDYLTCMLAKSCKIIPVLLVHLLIYRTRISNDKKLVAVLITVGVAIFTLGTNRKPLTRDSKTSPTVQGFVLLFLSLFMDGLTNASQDRLLKANRQQVKLRKASLITGAHLMVALNFGIILWNLSYLLAIDVSQLQTSWSMILVDSDIAKYLFLFSLCGAIGQCFIFYTLEQYGSLVLVTITVTRKMISMILSVVVFGKIVTPTQWLGILIVFFGISYEALSKRKNAKLVSEKKENEAK